MIFWPLSQVGLLERNQQKLLASDLTFAFLWPDTRHCNLCKSSLHCRSMGTPAQVPTSFGRELRACLRCRLIKTYDQFRETGCENCPFFNMDQDHDRVVDCTTSNFSGIISSMDPTRSWSARWLRISRFVPGCYTLSVAEVLSEEMQAVCEDNSIQYVPPKQYT